MQGNSVLGSTSSLTVKHDCLWLLAEIVPRRPESQYKRQTSAERCPVLLLHWVYGTIVKRCSEERWKDPERRVEVLTGIGWLFRATLYHWAWLPGETHVGWQRVIGKPLLEKDEGIRGPRIQLCAPGQVNPFLWTSVSPLGLGLGLEFTVSMAPSSSHILNLSFSLDTLGCLFVVNQPHSVSQEVSSSRMPPCIQDYNHPPSF